MPVTVKFLGMIGSSHKARDMDDIAPGCSRDLGELPANNWREAGHILTVLCDASDKFGEARYVDELGEERVTRIDSSIGGTSILVRAWVEDADRVGKMILGFKDGTPMEPDHEVLVPSDPKPTLSGDVLVPVS